MIETLFVRPKFFRAGLISQLKGLAGENGPRLSSLWDIQHGFGEIVVKWS